ncbi:MAG: hypothetical protein ACLTAI_08265 [Thomasclavelia sp.]
MLPSIDYDPKAGVSITSFLKKYKIRFTMLFMVKLQQKVIYHRADAEKEFVGLTASSGNHPTLREAEDCKKLP